MRVPRKRLLVLSAIAAAASLTVTSARATWHKPDMRATTSDGTEILWSEIQALRAAGVAPDDPKLTMLEEDLASLEATVGTESLPEPGIDMGGLLGEPHRGGTRSAELDRPAPVTWDSGVVECEPLPPDILTAAELTGARCVSAPQPDGTSRYVAIDPGGTVRVVRFATDGAVSRQPDQHVDLLGIPLDGAELVVEQVGDVLVSLSGEPVTTIDIG